ncbi:Lcl domain-containing protein [Magnetococcales bacterium HHB-1]
MASFFAILLLIIPIQSQAQGMVDTGQASCYNNRHAIRCPQPGEPFYGQDAQYQSRKPAYKDHGNGVVSDLNTGLMWSKGVYPVKTTLVYANQIAKTLKIGGFSDWRVPNIKELYSLIDFRGYTGFSRQRNTGTTPQNAIPFIDTDYFGFLYGNTQARERYIDAQWLTSTQYVSLTMKQMLTLFGVNFADGRIKGYGYRNYYRGGWDVKKFFARYVRGPLYGQNRFKDHGNGTITDQSTGLMWMKADSGKGLSWKDALSYAENLTYAGYSDWRLPNAKELQYIVDYSRSPNTTQSAAINSRFKVTPMTNEAGQKDYPYYWTSTTHLDGPTPGRMAVYLSFGRAMGQMRGTTMDVHGAGAQRSDPKEGHPSLGHGPQGDAIRIYNYVRCVRGGAIRKNAEHAAKNRYPNNINTAAFSTYASTATATKVTRTVSSATQSRFAKHFINKLDKDKDGRVSRQEFDGPAARFDVHDINRDGYLSENETPTPPPFFR